MGRFPLWTRLNIQSHQFFQDLPSAEGVLTHEPFHLAFLNANPGLSSITIVLDVTESL